jgi:hypothetical protein
MAHNTSPEDFKKWYQEFLGKYSGFRTSDKWFNRVEENHQNLRNKIGGVRLTLPIELKDVIPAVNFDDIDKITHQLLVQIPQYFYDYKFNRKDLCVPTVGRGEQLGMKFGKHIQTWCNRNNVSQEIKDGVAKVMSSLGEAWARSKTQKVKLYVTMTTDPKAFCMIGHYGVDYGSCFKQGGCNQSHKYMIGQTPNTYVLLVSNGPDDFEKVHENNSTKSTILARYWGVANEDLDIFGLVNWYQKKNEPEGNVYNATEQFFAELLGVEKAKKYTEQIKVPPVFQNKVINWCICKPDRSFSPQTFAMMDKYLSNLQKCSVCSDTFSYPDEGKEADHVLVCNQCADKSNICEFSGKATFKPLVKAVHFSGKEIMISETLVKERVFIEFDGVLYHNSLLIRLENNHFIKKDDSDNYKKCASHGCETYINIKEEGRSHCRRCLESKRSMQSYNEDGYGDWTVSTTHHKISYDKKTPSFRW